MAQQVNGRQILSPVQYDSYDHWRNFALTHGVNFDYKYGNQCWDLPALLWWQYGMYLVTQPQGNGHAYQCWTVSRYVNGRPPFTSITGVENIKRGDCLVFNKSGFSSDGHICFADADYKDRYYYNGAWRLNCLGQNQGQGTASGTPSNIAGINLANFLGIFRNGRWTTTPPPTPPSSNKSDFPWVLYARKLRNKK